jgi:uncharacterized protein with PIN domain
MALHSYISTDRERCPRCNQAPLRVVQRRVVAGVEKEQLTCDNPHCDHTVIRDAAPPLSHVDEMEAGD